MINIITFNKATQEQIKKYIGISTTYFNRSHYIRKYIDRETKTAFITGYAECLANLDNLTIFI
jgi:hypothetical protein